MTPDVDAIIDRLRERRSNDQRVPWSAAVAAVREAAGSEQVCRACGGSGHRNGSLRAADPFGTCPGCDGTGVQDRDAAHQFPTQHGFAVTVARALESAAEAVRRERLRIVDLIGSEFPDSMPLLAGDVIGMLQADFLDRAERSEHDDRD